MKILLTGAAGFAAGHLVPELVSHGHEVATTDVATSAPVPNYEPADLCDPDAMRALLRKTRPDACVHLGGMAFVPDGDRDPGRLLAVNVGGTFNLLKAIRDETPRARLLFISTAQVYGCSAGRSDEAVSETAPTRPLSMYMVSKVAGEQMVMAFGAQYAMDVLVARPANHTGPRQSARFVVPSMVEQARRIRRGEAAAFSIGNLASGRDFSDVRDAVSAYRLLVERGRGGEVYNVSAGQHFTVGEVLDFVRAASGVDAPAAVNPAFFRPTDFSRVLDTSKLRRETGWAPRFSLPETIRDMLASPAAGGGR